MHTVNTDNKDSKTHEHLPTDQPNYVQSAIQEGDIIYDLDRGCYARVIATNRQVYTDFSAITLPEGVTYGYNHTALNWRRATQQEEAELNRTSN